MNARFVLALVVFSCASAEATPMAGQSTVTARVSGGFSSFCGVGTCEKTGATSASVSARHETQYVTARATAYGGVVKKNSIDQDGSTEVAQYLGASTFAEQTGLEGLWSGPWSEVAMTSYLWMTPKTTSDVTWWGPTIRVHELTFVVVDEGTLKVPRIDGGINWSASYARDFQPTPVGWGFGLKSKTKSSYSLYSDASGPKELPIFQAHEIGISFGTPFAFNVRNPSNDDEFLMALNFWAQASTLGWWWSWPSNGTVSSEFSNTSYLRSIQAFDEFGNDVTAAFNFRLSDGTVLFTAAEVPEPSFFGLTALACCGIVLRVRR